MSSAVRQSAPFAAVLAAAAFAFVSPADAQEPAGRTTLIELTPHLAVNDAAERIEAMDYAGAIEILDTFNANQAEPVPEAHYLLALAHYQLGDHLQALPAARRAVELAPDAPASWLELVASVLKQLGDHRSAIPFLERLVELAPTNKTYWTELSLAYERVDDYEKSLATMRLAHAAELLTEDADYRRLSDLLVHEGIPLAAAEVLEQGLAARIVQPDEAAYTKVGTAWYMAGETDKAVPALENAARAADTGDAYVRLANLHITRQEWAAAIAALHAGMGRGSLTDEAHANLLMGVALYAQGKFDEAREWLTTAAESERHRAVANDYLTAIEARVAQQRAQ
jgi:tetratricopeptide (TPR) repeat protein